MQSGDDDHVPTLTPQELFESLSDPRWAAILNDLDKEDEEDEEHDDDDYGW